MFSINYDKAELEELILSADETILQQPFKLANSDYVVALDDDDRVLGLESVEVNGRLFKVGFLRQNE
ncbi:hypothetical protein [Undibacterium fentianense]|uniref:DUF2283 domain-containing protein n=1 Tax=Undibacterium fentianense TaxID=2828728 RepID=A0A941E177_9BURK|nr:hypothetical protein [Undibacterium fentianense]MBR7800495.1 hypothetical protein [Undibacterium fentianense]